MASASAHNNPLIKSSQISYRTKLHTTRRAERRARESPRTSVSTNSQHTQIAVSSTSQDSFSWKDSQSTGAFVRSAHQDVVIDLKGMGGWIEPGLQAIDGPLCWDLPSSQHRRTVDIVEEDLFSVGGWILPFGAPLYNHTSAFAQILERENTRENVEGWTMMEYWNEESRRGGRPWTVVRTSLSKKDIEGGNGNREEM